MSQQKIVHGIYSLITDGQNRVLMVRDAYRDHKLSLPGGGIETGELIIETACRETKEETGYDIEVGKLVGVFSHRKQAGVVHLFQAKIIGGQPILSSEEISWCGFVDINTHDPKDIYPAQLGMVQQFFSTDRSQWPIYSHMIPPLPVD